MLDAAANHRLSSDQQDAASAHDRSCAPSGSRWAVVATYANAEFRAERHLREQHFETYLPTILARRRHRFLSGRTTWSLLPLFPGYAFVALKPNQPWRAINHTLGVFRLLVDANGCPNLCRAGAVEALQAAEAIRRSLPAEAPPLAPGAAVAVANGILSGYPAVVLSVQRGTARIAVMFLGGLRTATVHLDQLTARDA